MFRYPSNTKMVRELTAIAREELEHFELVNQWLERLGLLAAHCPEPELAKFYRGLMASEARHYGIYWVLAATSFDKEIVMQRLDELAIVESDLLATLHPEPRIHS
jgi:tRNA 2-(methylsulfanyl)-N6-isopentenyladenosine37 hydroxylase